MRTTEKEGTAKGKATASSHLIALGLLLFLLLAPAVYAAKGLVTVLSVVNNGGSPSTYTVTLSVAETASISTSDHFGARYDGDEVTIGTSTREPGGVWLVTAISPATGEVTLEDSLTDEHGGEFGVPEAGVGWYSTPNGSISLVPFRARAADGALRRNDYLGTGLGPASAVVITGGSITGLDTFSVTDGTGVNATMSVVEADAGEKAFVVVDSGTGGNSTISFRTLGSEQAFAWFVEGSSQLRVGGGTGISYAAYSNGNPRMTILSGGNVGFHNSSPGYNVDITGNLNVSGTISKGGGSFQIDHPSDPYNKILRHSFLECPEQKNFYDGIAMVGSDGTVSVPLPSYFEDLNETFRYQLTPVGGWATVYVSTEITEGSFEITATEGAAAAGTRISWAVTGIRKDPWAVQNPMVSEETKGQGNPYTPGVLIHPSAYGE